MEFHLELTSNKIEKNMPETNTLAYLSTMFKKSLSLAAALCVTQIHCNYPNESGHTLVCCTTNRPSELHSGRLWPDVYILGGTNTLAYFIATT